MWTFCGRPIQRTHQDFAVALTLSAMKFVNWHGVKIVFNAIKSRLCSMINQIEKPQRQ